MAFLAHTSPSDSLVYFPAIGPNIKALQSRFLLRFTEVYALRRDGRRVTSVSLLCLIDVMLKCHTHTLTHSQLMVNVPP